MLGERVRKAALTEPQVRSVLKAFYADVREDPVLGPVFAAVIAPDGWDMHLEKVVRFWLTALSIQPGYRGRDFMPAHLRHRNIRAEHAPHWLKLFERTVVRHCSAVQSEALMAVAAAMMENILIGLAKRDAQANEKGEAGAPACGRRG